MSFRPAGRVPRLIPVLDVMAGRVVRAVAGRRCDYRPVVSRLTGSSDPPAVARAVLSASGATELYVADLDAIRGGSRVSPAVSRLLELHRGPVWLDVGLGPLRRPAVLPDLPHLRAVVGLETATGMAPLVEAVARFGPGRVAVSLDLCDGSLLGSWVNWGAAHARDVRGVAVSAVASGARRLIVLDLARVGTGTGPGTEDVLRLLRSTFAGAGAAVELIAGGGIRSWADVERLGEAGADAVLLASALHDGTLRPPRRDGRSGG
jgi:phosphoribosylformimino-5-aminoimidazole carboxamide ribotide isomerase